MKKFLFALSLAAFLSTFTSCAIFKRKEKRGCPTDGRNVGAEKLASGDPKAVKQSQKAKFKGTTSF
jgi:hypothetical protein